MSVVRDTNAFLRGDFWSETERNYKVTGFGSQAALEPPLVPSAVVSFSASDLQHRR